MTDKQSQASNWLSSPMGLVLCGFLIIAAFFLFTEHRAHVLGILPYVLLLLCPILHLLMHRKHGGHGGSNGGPTDDQVEGHKHNPRGDKQ
ncbi:MAG: DUF2933 domain-containing protein [Thermoproteota archaeon]